MSIHTITWIVFNRFNETELPKRKDFYGLLNDTDISEDEYQHAREVWNSFKIRNLGQYHDFYLKTDVLLLAERLASIIIN